MAKTRLDLLLLEQGLALSREKARAMILAGEVWINGIRVDKPGTSVSDQVQLEIKSNAPRYVSRGGLKLEKALIEFQIDFTGQVVLDVGASTGGYTHCALQNGARLVYALDVGYGQLDWSLRNDSRVVTMERTNIRYLKPEEFPELVDIITIDVSFISTGKVFPVVTELLKPEGQIVCLIKPQFEAGRALVGKKGVVRDPRVHRQVLEQCIAHARQQKLYCHQITYSPITGPKGNIEYFILLKKAFVSEDKMSREIIAVVSAARNKLGGSPKS